MNLYEEYCLPHILNCACGMKAVRQQRQKVVPLAEGSVLEIGMGSGLNIPYYNSDKVDFVWALEPSKSMRKKAATNVGLASFDVRWLELPSESIPLDDNSVDTVLLTYTLCTIPDWKKALQEMRRVLKPSGKLVFCEHGNAPDANIRRWQERLNPMWKKIAGGCHLNRPIPHCLEQGGFTIHTMDAAYLKGPKFVGFNYWGVAN